MIAKTRITFNSKEIQDYETTMKGNQMLPHAEQVHLEKPEPVTHETEIAFDVDKIDLAFVCKTDANDSIVIYYQDKMHYLVYSEETWAQISRRFS